MNAASNVTGTACRRTSATLKKNGASREVVYETQGSQRLKGEVAHALPETRAT
jgi:hypothetical protein